MVGIGWSTCWGKCVWILLPWAPLITWSTLGGGSGQAESCKVVFFILGKFSHLQALGINWSSTTAVIECQRLSGWNDPVSVFSNILSRWHCGSFRDRVGSWEHSPYCVSRRKKQRRWTWVLSFFLDQSFDIPQLASMYLPHSLDHRGARHTICGSRT